VSNLDAHRDNKYLYQFVEQLGDFTADHRQSLGRLYGISDATPEGLAQGILKDPERLIEVVQQEVVDSPSWGLLQDLVFDHNMLVPIPRGSKKAAKQLSKLGLISVQGDECFMTGVVASMLAPLVPGTPSSCIVLLGMTSSEQLERMARWWKVKPKHRMAMVLELAELMTRPGIGDSLIDLLPDPEYLSPAMLAVELGGVCFWQEVFGFESDSETGVLPLIRRDDLAMEKEMSSTLRDVGIVFKIHEGPQSMLVVPEEYWPALWEVGCTWLRLWISESLETLHDQMVRRLDERPDELQPVLKWILCEVEGRSWAWPGDRTSLLLHLSSIGGRTPSFWGSRLDLGIELGVFATKSNRLIVEDTQDLDANRGVFVRNVLGDWCLGEVAAHTETHVGKALGLDEVWRREVLKVLKKSGESVPSWLHSEGVESLLTGSGFLKDSLDTPKEVLMAEFVLAHDIMYSIRQGWLDLLSVMSPTYWYAKEHVLELFGMVACFELFSHVSHAIDGSGMAFYIPFQRSSLLMEPVHLESFRLWLDDTIEGFLIPLGVATQSPDGESIWFDTSALRVPTLSWMDEGKRIERVEQMFAGKKIEFSIPAEPEFRLHRVPELEDHELGLEVPVHVMRSWLRKREIIRFDGRRIYTK